MNVALLVEGGVQVGGGVVGAPLLPGVVQWAKAALQGRRGPGPLQPYRELRRLWGKSTVTVERSTVVYRAAPAFAAAAVVVAVLVVPAAQDAPSWGIGHDMFVLVGLLALARFAVALAAWDVGNGFSLMGASRDLTISVFVETAFVLAMAVAALSAGTTDLAAMVAGLSGGRPWSTPALGLAALAFVPVVVAETGRQPVDNPDTHLELTMIHEGALLEYAGRDQAYLQWAGAARHWIVLVVAAQVFLPHPGSPAWQLVELPWALLALTVLLAALETAVAKMRLLVVPRMMGIGSAVALLGVAAWLAGT